MSCLIALTWLGQITNIIPEEFTLSVQDFSLSKYGINYGICTLTVDEVSLTTI